MIHCVLARKKPNPKWSGTKKVIRDLDKTPSYMALPDGVQKLHAIALEAKMLDMTLTFHYRY